MKKGLRIFLIILFLLLIFFSSFYIYLSIKAKPIIIHQLERFLNRKVKIDKARISFPLNLEIKNLVIEGLLESEFIFASPDIFGILSGRIALSELRILKPKFNFKREKTSFLDKPEGKTTNLSSVLPKRKIKIFLQKVIVDKGYINFSDTIVKPEGIVLVVKDLDLNIENLTVPPGSNIIRFSLRGDILWQEDERKGRLEASGWIDLYNKDMQANLEIFGIDGVYLSPYYSRYLSLQDLGIKKAILNFFSQIQSHKNDLVANCQLELSDIVFKEKAPEEKEKIVPQEVVKKTLDIFKIFEGKVALNFVIKTKMDSLQFKIIEDIKMAVEEKISEAQKIKEKFGPEDIVKLPARVLRGTIKETTEVSKAVIEGVKAIGLEIKKTLEEAFKREEEE